MKRFWRQIATSALLAGVGLYAFASPTVQVTIRGVSKKMGESLLKAVTLAHTKPSKDTLPSRIRLLYRQGETEILQNLKPIGFYGAHIGSTISHKKDAWNIIYTVDLGKPVMVAKTNIVVDGADSKAHVFKRIIRKSGVITGTIFLHSAYMDLKTKLLDKAFHLGFFDAKYIKHQIKINLASHKASIALQLELGKRYTFGPVKFDQKGYKFYQAFLRGYIPFGKNEPYNANIINQFQTNINNSNYFTTAFVKQDNNAKTKKTDITLKTVTRPAQEYVIGPGYGTETGPRILLGWKYRHITKSGQHFSAQIQLSKIYRNLNVAYIIPGKHPVTDFYSINANQHYTDISAYHSLDTMAGADWIRRRGHFGFSIGAHEHWITYTPQNQSRNNAYYLIPSITLMYSNKRRAGYFDRGISFNMTGQGALKKIASSSSFLQGIATGKISLPTSKDNRFLLRGSVGSTKTSNYRNLATPLRFYAGGLGSVLGYQYKSLSPSASTGLVGGKDILTAAIKFEQRLYGNISGLLVYNAGNAFNQFQDMKLQQGAGIGFSYRSVVGPINLYITRPINNPTLRKPRINFSIGWFL